MLHFGRMQPRAGPPGGALLVLLALPFSLALHAVRGLPGNQPPGLSCDARSAATCRLRLDAANAGARATAPLNRAARTLTPRPSTTGDEHPCAPTSAVISPPRVISDFFTLIHSTCRLSPPLSNSGYYVSITCHIYKLFPGYFCNNLLFDSLLSSFQLKLLKYVKFTLFKIET